MSENANPHFRLERNFFRELSSGLAADQELRKELSESVQTVLTRYNTSVWENRFIAGGVVEQIIGATARDLGLSVENAGKQNQGYDLEICSDPIVGISIKGVFASVGGMHNLVNVRSSDPDRDLSDRWSTATLFVMSGVGIGYTDPEFGAEFLKSSSDALQISGRKLREWWSVNPEWLIDVPIPPKPTGLANRVASDAVSLDIFADFPRLHRSWKPEI
jgi:hypothetical protein